LLPPAVFSSLVCEDFDEALLSALPVVLAFGGLGSQPQIWRALVEKLERCMKSFAQDKT
jgi:hypothetical protein